MDFSQFSGGGGGGRSGGVGRSNSTGAGGGGGKMSKGGRGAGRGGAGGGKGRGAAGGGGGRQQGNSQSPFGSNNSNNGSGSGSSANPFQSGGRPTLSYDNNNPTAQINKMLGGPGVSGMGGGMGGGGGGGGHMGSPPAMVRNNGQQPPHMSSTGVASPVGNRQNSPFGGGRSRTSSLQGSGIGDGSAPLGQGQGQMPFGSGAGGGKGGATSTPWNRSPQDGRGKGGRGVGGRGSGRGAGAGKHGGEIQGQSYGQSMNPIAPVTPFGVGGGSGPIGGMKKMGSPPGSPSFGKQRKQQVSGGINFSQTDNIAPSLSDVFGLNKNPANSMQGAGGGRGGGGKGKNVIGSGITDGFGVGGGGSDSGSVANSRNSSPARGGKGGKGGKGRGRSDINNHQGAGAGDGNDMSGMNSRHTSPSGRGGGDQRGKRSAGGDTDFGNTQMGFVAGDMTSSGKGGGKTGGKGGKGGGRGVGRKGGAGGKGHSGGPALSCRVCHATFTSKTEMFAHLESEKHYDADVKKAAGRVQSPSRDPPTCQKCGLSFPTHNKLRTHLIESQHFNTKADTPAIPADGRQRSRSNTIGSGDDEVHPGPLMQHKVWTPDKPPAPPRVDITRDQPRRIALSNDETSFSQGKISDNFTDKNIATAPPPPPPAAPLSPALTLDDEFPTATKKKSAPRTNKINAGGNNPFTSKKFAPKADPPTPPLSRSPSIRADGTVRKEFRERKPGYVPQEEVPAYMPPHMRGAIDTVVPAAAPPLTPTHAPRMLKKDSFVKTKGQDDVVTDSKKVPKNISMTRSAAPVRQKAENSFISGDRHPDGGLIGQCIDMCPTAERSRGGNNPRKIDVLEESLDLSVSALQDDDQHRLDLKYTMIKKYEKSSADRNMSQPLLVRTPATLLKTIEYMEENIMDVDRHAVDSDDEEDDGNESGLEDKEGRGPSKYHVHNFIWDRMRSIYGDFIVQNYRLGGRVDAYCVETHERMARWHLMMEHHMQWNTESHHAGFDRQNSERYISILKSLDEFYNMVHLLEDIDHSEPYNGTNRPFPIPNEGELRSYFILYQMDNQGASDKYIKTLRPEVLDHPDMQFALKVIQARRSENYGKFFRLLRECNYLQGCAMFRFVAPMRLHALNVINKVMRPGKNEASFSVHDLQELLCFNNVKDVLEYLEYFEFNVTSQVSKDGEESYRVILHGNPLEFQTDDDGKEIKPPLQFMRKYVEGKLGERDRCDVSRGLLSGAVNFEGDEGDVIYIDEDNELVEGGGVKENSRERAPSIVETIRAKLKRGDNVSSDDDNDNADTAELEKQARHAAATEKLQKFKEEKERKKREDKEKSDKGLPEQNIKKQLQQSSETNVNVNTETVQSASDLRQQQDRKERQLQQDKQKKQQEQLQQEQLKQRQQQEQKRKQEQEQRQRQRELSEMKAAEDKKQHQIELHRAQELQREKVTAAERLRLKDQQLTNLEEKINIIAESRLLVQMWSMWQGRTIRRLKDMKTRRLQLVFGVWRRQLGKVRLRREKLDAQLMAIDFGSQLKGQRMMSDEHDGNRVRMMVKRRVESYGVDNHFVSVFGGKKTSLSAAKHCLFRELPSQSPFLSPSLAVGSGLLQVQSDHLNVTTSSMSQLWSQDLFFDLAVISSCRKFQRGVVPGASTWDHSHCVLPNIIRTLLCDESLSIPGDQGTIAQYDSVVPCLLGVEVGQSTRHMRRVRMRVKDCPSAIDQPSSVESLKESSLKMNSGKFSAALVVVPDIVSCLRGDDCLATHPNIKLQQLLRNLSGQSVPAKRVRTENFRDSSDNRIIGDAKGDDGEELVNIIELFLSGVLDSCVPLVEQGTPIVLLFTREVISFNSSDMNGPCSKVPDPASFDEVSSDDHTENLLVSVFSKLLCRRSKTNVTNIKQSFYVHANLLNSDLYNTRNELFSRDSPKNFSGLSEVITTCGRCLFACLDCLALASRPIPLVERVDIASWAEEVMLDALWRSNNFGEKLQCQPHMKSLDNRQSAGSRELVQSVVHNEVNDLNIASVLNGIVSAVNGGLKDMCLKRISCTLEMMEENLNVRCESLFPFDLQNFAATSTRIGTGDGSDVYGSQVVKGIIYNNMSDRRTRSCGAISSALPVNWDQPVYLKSVFEKVQATLYLPTVVGDDISDYVDLLIKQGWYMDAAMKSRLEEIQSRLQVDLAVLQNSLSSSMVVAERRSGAHLLPSKISLKEHWTMINLNILSLKRLISRVIEFQCEDSGDKVFDDDVYLVVAPVTSLDVISDQISDATSHDAALRFHFPDCPDICNSSVDDEGCRDGKDNSRCKRRFPHDSYWEEDGSNTALVAGIHPVSSDPNNPSCSSIVVVDSLQADVSQSGKKKSRLAFGEDIYHPHDGYKQEVYAEVRQLGQECKDEIEESLNLEARLSRVLVDEAGFSFNDSRDDCSVEHNDVNMSRDRWMMMDNFESTSSHGKHSLHSETAWPLEQSYNNLDDTLSKENLSANKEMKPSSALDIISQFRDERLKLNAWMESMN